MTFEKSTAAVSASLSNVGLAVCGIVHDYTGCPKDRNGCRLPDGHEGAHEFVADDGAVYRWEIDLECTCEHCMRCDGDYCTTYWRVTP